MKRILVPCDFSEPSKQAFKFAVGLASATKSEVFILHVVETPVLHSSMLVPVEAYEKSFLKGLRTKYDKNVEKMKEQWGGKVKIHSSIEHGSVESGIQRFAQKKRIDLIVMGTHGAKGIRDLVIGSNTEKTLRHSQIPVIAIKKAPQLASIKDIILPTDFSKINKEQVVFIKDLQAILKARLQVVYVNSPENFTTNLEAERSLAEFVLGTGFKNYTLSIFNDITEEQGISNFSQRFKNKLLVMPTHGRTGLSHFFNGSVTEEVVKNTDWPVLTLHK